MIETLTLRIRKILPTDIEYFRRVSEVDMIAVKKLGNTVYNAIVDDAFKSLIEKSDTEIFLI